MRNESPDLGNTNAPYPSGILIANPSGISSLSPAFIVTGSDIAADKSMPRLPSVAYSVAHTYETVGPEMIKKLTNWGTAYVVDHAIMPKSPSSPHVERDSVIGFFVGLLLCAAVLIVIKFSDHRIYCVEDIEDALSITVIGQLPKCIVDENAPEPYEAVGKGDVI